MSLEQRIDAALRAFAESEPHGDDGSGVCKAHNEGLNCCLDKEHERYPLLVKALAEALQ